MLILILIVSFKGNNKIKKSSSFISYSYKVLSLFALFCNTILTIPFFDSFFAVIFCHSDSILHKSLNCYSGIYFLHLSFAIIGLLILCFFTIIFSLLYIDLNPNSNIPFASPLSKTNFLKLFIKICIPLYFAIDVKVLYF